MCAFNPHSLSAQNYLAMTEEFMRRRSARAIASPNGSATAEIVVSHERALETLERFRSEAAQVETARAASGADAGRIADDGAPEHAARPLAPALKLGVSHLLAAAAGVVLGIILGPRILDVASQAAALLH